MAVDEALAESTAEQGAYCFRIYRWTAPTLSLGYFQSSADREKHPASAACPLVRRTTGGGAIVHDHEITYSLTLPAAAAEAKRHLLLYEAVHGSLIDALAAWGVAAELCAASRRSPTEPSPFLCFQRRAPGDVLLGPIKIAGSAQRRIRGAVLQHGSILWSRSAAAPELPGLSEAVPALPPEEEFLHGWRRELAKCLRLEWRPDGLNPTERRRAEELHRHKYSTDVWNDSRGRPPAA